MSDRTRAGSIRNWMLAFLSGGVTGATLGLLLARPGDSQPPTLERDPRDTAAFVLEVENRLRQLNRQIDEEHRGTEADAAMAATTATTWAAQPAALLP